jgi:hypothetical protein
MGAGIHKCVRPHREILGYFERYAHFSGREAISPDVGNDPETSQQISRKLGHFQMRGVSYKICLGLSMSLVHSTNLDSNNGLIAPQKETTANPKSPKSPNPHHPRAMHPFLAELELAARSGVLKLIQSCSDSATVM